MGCPARSHQSAAERTRPTTPWPHGAAGAGSCPAAPAPPGGGARRIVPRLPQGDGHGGRGLLADEVGEAADRIARGRPVDVLRVDDEPVELGVGLEEGQVGLDRRGHHRSRGVVALDRLAELGQQLRGDPVADRDVELGPVGEVPVDDGLARAGLGGDLLHAYARPVLADRGERGVDQLPAARGAVLVPPRIAAVAGTPGRRGSLIERVVLVAGHPWLRLATLATVRDLVVRRASHRLGFHVTYGIAYGPYRPTHPTLEAPMASSPKPATRQAAIVGGNRIPFARSNSAYARASNQDMLTATLDGLVARLGLQGKEVGEVVAGAVLKHSRDFNLTRESVLGSKLAATTPAYDVQQACGTGLEAAILVANKIALGQIESGIAGGVDTTSDAPLAVGDDLRRV